MRFGIGMSADQTLDEVGQQFSVSRERKRFIFIQQLKPHSCGTEVTL